MIPRHGRDRPYGCAPRPGRHISGLDWPQDEPVIIYLPVCGRERLRGAGDCSQDLAPLVWFAVAGNFFGQPKQARDWTLRGFLAAQGSPVGLDIPEDKATREALARAASWTCLPRARSTPSSALRRCCRKFAPETSDM